ncbi:hypothetical protein BMF94_5113 [Rhodotorula taiwanensis]|uniref:Uncharacterized protein n=1 Tax=Rhodotorula taiwanensis TaxID=741276 RepID=A0A2S5B4P1_9BASI|nr:hypothetical protein BMF94_5113 [Rhodotorula taiwanensis]
MRHQFAKAWAAIGSSMSLNGGAGNADLPTYDRLGSETPKKPNLSDEKPSAYGWTYGSPFSSSRSVTPDLDTSTTSRHDAGRHSWKQTGIAAVVGLLVGLLLAHSNARDPATARGPTRKGVWSQFGFGGRTLNTWQYGFGSTTISALQAMLFAKAYDYEVIFTRERNAYGAYLDFFEPKQPEHCRITEDMYQVDDRVQLQEITEETQRTRKNPMTPRDAPHIRSSSDDTHPLNRYARDTTFTRQQLDRRLPALDSTRPKPGPDNVPSLFAHRYIQFSALTAEHFQLNARIRARRDMLRSDMGLLETNGRPVIGMHYRGGDKLKHECRPSSQIGNITLHCETALDALRSFTFAHPRFEIGRQKARLVLMTAEPDALKRIENEPICSRYFDISAFPRGGTNKPYKQTDFYELSLDDRIDDTERFLAEADILANYVDAAVVSANSNTGRLIFTRGGPSRTMDEYRVRSVDLPWHPMQFPPFANVGCDGTTGHCFPEADA